MRAVRLTLKGLRLPRLSRQVDHRLVSISGRRGLQIHIMKRAATTSASPVKAKKPKTEVPEYHLATSIKDEDGEIVWPAPKDQIAQARKIILQCAKENKTTLIVPDKDADGLTSGAIMYKTLKLLGVSKENLHYHLLEKGNTVHSDAERERMAERQPSYIFVLDQGSRKSSSLIDPPHTGLVIDHHFAHEVDFPADSSHVTACMSPPVATASLLTFEICKPLHPEVHTQCAWLCAIGTMGDLGTTIKWQPPFPDMTATFKEHKKKNVTDAIGLLNAPRRTATFDVSSAMTALMAANTPKDILSDTRLLAARKEINEEVERCTHTAPKFSIDGKIAVFKIKSGAQIHPLIATRWANHLSSPKLEIVMCANSGHMADKVNFSCRIARSAKANDPPVDIIQTLKDVAEAHESGTLRERMGEDFARGHVQASGGIVGQQEFDDLMSVLRVGEKPEKKEGEQTKKSPSKPVQKNTLANYFGKS